MSLSMVTIVAASGESVELPIGVSSGYQLEDIEGLDPVKATIASSNFGGADGASYQSSRRDPRNIVMRIEMIPDFVTTTVQSLRQGLAAKMMPKSAVRLQFHDEDGSVVYIDGRVESFEAPLFTREPKAVISFLCLRPDFISETETVVTGNSVSDLTNMTINYPGTVDTGFSFEMTLNRSTNEIAFVMQTADGETKRMDFAMSLVSGDIIEFSSIFGNKGVWVTKSGARSSALYATTSVSQFLTLARGPNAFRTQISGAAIPYTIRYHAKYGGL